MHLPLLSAVTASVLPAGGWSDLGHNYIFTAGFWGWFIAQSLKVSRVFPFMRLKACVKLSSSISKKLVSA